EQQAAWKELGDILATIQDEKSMADAKVSLEERSKKVEAITQKANALPNPPPASVIKRMEEDRFTMERTIERVRGEIRRIRRDVKGGEEFVSQLGSRSPGLLPAVKQ